MSVILLGPQRFRTTAGRVVRSLDAPGAVATVSAGWEEREGDDAELDRVLDGRAVNLRLYARWLDVQDRDPELAAADARRRDVLDELQSVYALRLHHAMEATYAVQRRRGRPDIDSAALADALQAVRDLDARHLGAVADVHAEFEAANATADRPVVAEHRAAVAAVLGRAGALAIAGGHVGVLLRTLRLFDVWAAAVEPGGLPVVAWSAGAMALAERVVLFHDLAPHGAGHAEAYDAGLGLCLGVVPLPHARRRLRLDDPARMSIFARRFAPARCVVLDDGVRVDWDAPGGPGRARVLGEDGRVTTLEAA